MQIYLVRDNKTPPLYLYSFSLFQYQKIGFVLKKWYLSKLQRLLKNRIKKEWNSYCLVLIVK